MAFCLKSILNEAGLNVIYIPHLTFKNIQNDLFLMNKEISKDDLIKILKDTEKILGNDKNLQFLKFYMCIL